MIRTSVLKTLLTVIAALFVSGNMYAASPNDNGEWTVYTGFDCQPKKIMDGDRYTYFWVHQNYYNPSARTSTPYRKNNGGLLFFDKEQPQLGIRSIHERGSMHSATVRNAAYNPTGQYLLVVYNDGVIDIIEDNGDIHTIKDLVSGNVPFIAESFNISFPVSNNDAWIGMTSGFVQIDGNTFTVKQAVNLGKRITSICQVGSKVVAIVSPNYYEADAEKPIDSFADFTDKGKLVASPEFIMPITDNAFVTTNGNYLGIVKRDDAGALKYTQICGLPGFSGQLIANNSGIQYNSYVTLNSENNVIPTKDGYLLFTTTDAYLIPKQLNTNGTILNADIKTRKFETSSPRYVGSNDFENFWFYTSRKGFRRSKASGFGTTTWTNGEYMMPNGPLCSGRSLLAYSPNHGLLNVNEGTNVNYKSFSKIRPTLLTAFKNGKWNNLSPAYNKPRVCDDNSELNTIYTKNPTYPIADPKGLFVDPLNPDFAFMGSVYDGIAIVNMADPNSTIFQFAATNSAYAKFPGFTGFVTPDKDMNFCLCIPGGFDNTGNFWIYYVDWADNLKDGPSINLWCLTPEDRNEALRTGDASKFGEWKKFSIITQKEFSNVWATCLAPSHLKNKNYVISAIGQWPFSVTIFDHKGTLDDITDDESKTFSNVITPDGSTLDWSYLYNIKEDPVTGKILLCTFENLIAIDPSQPVTNGIIPGEIFSISKPDGSKENIIPYQAVNSVCFDQYNRCWIATNNIGVVGVNADKTKIIARYNTDNSAIPSNTVYDVCWNPDTQELFVSTDEGIASVRPDLPTESNAVAAALKPYCSPVAINPDYSGAVTLYNIPAQSIINVYNKDGHVVRTLNTSISNLAVWDLRDRDGKMVPSGKYIFSDSTGLIDDMEVYLLR